MSDTGRKEDPVGIDDGVKAGTEKTPATPVRPVPGDQAMRSGDVAPKRGKAKWGLIFLITLIAIIVIAALFWADDAPDLDNPPQGDVAPGGVIVPAD
ncbi:hypothetical protein JSE7799_00104 [Jannaschia seosinensis]|uniref:Uncharacterized protein n=1 Tax=Jannaschia seosinensis TaxID=313367 RepID=A0A0M7B606_9RHOB|nr:hypothetical protein [Jannaschia seosinensis]CUH09531.1 hypothetical protein JSE7799_00104 [Jannaschia seosinensis]